MERAIITNIQGYSIHDGPGIRTVVFMKGCPLRCIWCANPENLTPNIQIGFIRHLCQNCGRCAAVCRHGAILPGDGPYRHYKMQPAVLHMVYFFSFSILLPGF